MIVLGSEIPIKENIQRSLHDYRYLWVILLATVFFDFVSTVLFMERDGIRTEGNSVVRNLALTVGIVPGVAIGKLLQIVAAIGFSALSTSLARATLLLILLLNVIAVIKNLL